MHEEGFYDPTDRVINGRFVPQREQNSVGDMLREVFDNFCCALREEILPIARGAKDLLKSLPFFFFVSGRSLCLLVFTRRLRPPCG